MTKKLIDFQSYFEQKKFSHLRRFSHLFFIKLLFFFTELNENSLIKSIDVAVGMEFHIVVSFYFYSAYQSWHLNCVHLNWSAIHMQWNVQSEKIQVSQFLLHMNEYCVQSVFNNGEDKRKSYTALHSNSISWIIFREL